MIETLLNYGEDCKSSLLQSQLYYKDEAGKMDSFITANADNQTPNSGFVNRFTISKGGKSFEVIAPLHADIFNLCRLILNKVNIKI